MKPYSYDQRYQQQISGYPAQPARSSDPTFITHLIVSIALAVFLPIVGIPVIIMTLIAHNAWRQGRHEAYEKMDRAVKVTLTVGWIIEGIIAVVVTVVSLNLGYQVITSGF